MLREKSLKFKVLDILLQKVHQRSWVNFLYCLLIFFVSLGIFFYRKEVVFAQPLDPSLPGYKEVRPPERPTLKIVTPERNSTVLGSKVTVEYIISGISLIKQEENPSANSGQGKINVRGEGHLRLVFAREGYPVPTPILFARKSSITFENIPEGNYRITMEIVKNSGESFDPSVQDTTKFKILHSVTPTPTLTPTPSPTPLPFPERLRERFPLTHQQLLIVFGVAFLVGPTVYLFVQKMR